MKLLRIVSVSIISTTLLGGEKSPIPLSFREVGFKLPPLFQQREIKGNYAGNQIIALGLLKQCMKHDGFRQYAQERFQSEKEIVLNHLLGKSQHHSLGKDGEIPSDRLVPMNGLEKCSLSFSKGNFNIKRKGFIRRVPKFDVDSTLRQLDDKTIHHYLALAKIGMSRCEDDSVILRPHLELKGGSWQFIMFNNIMFISQSVARLGIMVTIGQGVQRLGEIGAATIEEFREGSVNLIRPYLHLEHRQLHRFFIDGLRRTGEGTIFMARQFFRTPAEYVSYMAGNGGQMLAEQGIQTLRYGTNITGNQALDTVMGRQGIVAHGVELLTDLARDVIIPGAGGPTIAAAEILQNQFPEVAQAVAEATIVTWGSWAWITELMEWAWINPFRS